MELLKEALRPVDNVDSEDIEKITIVKVRETDEFIVNELSAQEGILTVKYEMPAVIFAKSDDDSVCFYVTTLCTGEAEIPDMDSYNWNGIEFDSLNRTQILEYSHLIKKISLSYEDIKVDDEAVYCMKRAISENNTIEDKEVDKEEVGCKEKSIFENRTVIKWTCIPYYIIIFVAFYGYTVGCGWMDSYSDGWYGVVDSLELFGLLLLVTPLWIPFLACIIYHILCIIHRIKKR